jgi:PmbA protein
MADSGGAAPEDLLVLARAVAEQAVGDEHIEVYVARRVDTDIRAYGGRVESLSQATSAGAGVRVVAGGRQGFASTGSLEPDRLAAALAEARDNLRFATPDEHVVMAVPDGVAAAELDLWAQDVETTPVDAKVALALALEAEARKQDRRVRQVASADYGDLVLETALASSTGVQAASRRTAASLAVAAVAGEGADSQTGVGISAGRGVGSLDVSAAAADAVARATRMIGAAKGASTRTTVVFDPRVTATILGVVASAVSGDAVVKGRSMLADRLGEPVAASSVTIVDDPTDPRMFGAAQFDGEGLACRRNLLVAGGVLRSFVYDTVAARRAGTVSTGSAVRGGYASTPTAGCRAVLLEPGEHGPEEIFALVGDGLYVQSVTGVHSGVSPVSGDFSVGAEGLVIRGGELAEPVREVTVASTLPRMLQAILHIGADVQWLPGGAAGQTVAIADLTVSGT